MKTEGERRVLVFGSRRIHYQLLVKPGTRLRVTVHPDLTVEAQAPEGIPQDEVERALRSKAPWIARKLDAVAAHHPLPVPHRYVSGETLLYLGRQYRLRIEVGERSPAKLRGRFLYVTVPYRSDRESARRSVDAWFRARAGDAFRRHFDACLAVAARHGTPTPALAIRKMRTRWGSCSPEGRVTLNLHLIQAPAHCIDYVIMHELCHLSHHDHSPHFYRLLTRCMPDWRRRKRILEGDAPLVGEAARCGEPKPSRMRTKRR